MVPTEFMAAAVAMLTDALPKFLYFGNKFFPCHLIKVGVHNVLPSVIPSSYADVRINQLWSTVPRTGLACDSYDDSPQTFDMSQDRTSSSLWH